MGIAEAHEWKRTSDLIFERYETTGEMDRPSRLEAISTFIVPQGGVQLGKWQLT